MYKRVIVQLRMGRCFRFYVQGRQNVSTEIWIRASKFSQASLQGSDMEKKKFVKIVTTLIPTTYVYVFTLYLQETHYFKPI